MQGTRFAQFSTEALRRGAAAVLPQHLPDRWLDALLEEADLLAPEAWDSQEEDRVHECCAGLLGAVLVVLMAQRGHPDQLDVAVGTLMSHLHCYILALAAERSAVTPISGSNRRRWRTCLTRSARPAPRRRGRNPQPSEGSRSRLRLR